MALALAGPEYKISADRLEGNGFVLFAQTGATPAVVTGIGSLMCGAVLAWRPAHHLRWTDTA